MIDKTILLGDIGGTNARFALTSPNDSLYTCFEKFRCVDFDTVIEAINSYLKGHDIDNLQEIYLAIAAPVSGDKVKIINNHWVIDTVKIKKTLNVKKVNIINDFASIANSVATLDQNDIEFLGSESSFSELSQFDIAIVGPGTGLGGSVIKKTKKGSYISALELGHVGFSPQNEIQMSLFNILSKNNNRVINETLLSGPGIANIYCALLELNSKKMSSLTSEQIFSQIQECEFAKKTVDIFFEILGQVAGDFALSTGAFDGVLLVGDLVNNHIDLIHNSLFRFGFDNKDDYRNLMLSIPTGIIKKSELGLSGVFELYQESYKTQSDS